MGIKFIYLTTIAFSFLSCMAQDGADQLSCSNIAGSVRRVSLTVNTKREDTGEWITTFSARRNSSNLTKQVNLDVGHEIIDCNGQQIVHIHGVVRDKDNLPEERDEGILFYKKGSNNSVIKNNGRTLAKKDLVDTALALTSRPLMDNELLEVVVDKRNNIQIHAMGIGVTVNSPTDIEVPDHMFSIKNDTWVLLHRHVFHNGRLLKFKYLKSHLNVEVGGRVGVMRKSSGALHFYVNGVDKGAATLNLPISVYGAVELWGDAVQATIVNPI